MIERGEPPPATVADLTAALHRLECLRALIRGLAADERERTLAQVIIDTAEHRLANPSVASAAQGTRPVTASRPVVLR
jgi:hypothetical protein